MTPVGEVWDNDAVLRLGAVAAGGVSSSVGKLECWVGFIVILGVEKSDFFVAVVVVATFMVVRVVVMGVEVMGAVVVLVMATIVVVGVVGVVVVVVVVVVTIDVMSLVATDVQCCVVESVVVVFIVVEDGGVVGNLAGLFVVFGKDVVVILDGTVVVVMICFSVDVPVLRALVLASVVVKALVVFCVVLDLAVFISGLNVVVALLFGDILVDIVVFRGVAAVVWVVMASVELSRACVIVDVPETSCDTVEL